MSEINNGPLKHLVNSNTKTIGFEVKYKTPVTTEVYVFYHDLKLAKSNHNYYYDMIRKLNRKFDGDNFIFYTECKHVTLIVTVE